MTISQKILKILKCCLHNDGHIVKDPIILACGCNACEKCIEYNETSELRCLNCEKIFLQSDVRKMPSNPQASVFVETFLSDLMSLLKSQFEDTIRSFEKSTFDEYINRKLKFIADEIDSKIDWLKKNLDILRNDFHNQLKTLQFNLQKVTPYNTIDQVKKEMEHMEMYSENPSVFYSCQNKFKELKVELQNCIRKISDIRYEKSNLNVDKRLIGSIIHSFNSDYTQVKTTRSIKIPQSDCLVRMAYLQKQNKICLIDYKRKSVRLISPQNGEIVKQLQHECIVSPRAICSDSDDLIYIGDRSSHEILVFNSDGNFKRKFGDDTIKLPSSMKIDTSLRESQKTLFISDWLNNEISVWNCTKGKLLHKFEIDSPVQIEVKNSKLYVVSGVNFEWKKVTRKLERMTKGSNCVFIINTDSYDILGKISLETWLGPFGIQVDDQMNVLIPAYELDMDKIVSKNRSIYVFNDNGEYKHKINANADGIEDILLINNRLITCFNDELAIIEFKQENENSF